MIPRFGDSDMSTVHRRGPAPFRPQVWAVRGGVALAVVLLGLVAWFGPGLYDQARAGAAFGARIGCSCHFVEGRPLAQCKGDFEAGMSLVTLSSDDTAKSVTARFPLLASQTATFHEGQGCVLPKWGQ